MRSPPSTHHNHSQTTSITWTIPRKVSTQLRPREKSTPSNSAFPKAPRLHQYNPNGRPPQSQAPIQHQAQGARRFAFHPSPSPLPTPSPIKKPPPPPPPPANAPALPHTADYSADEADEETQSHLQKEIDDAEKAGHDTGKKGSFLNKLIEHGNRKTEEQIKRESLLGEQKVGAVDYGGVGDKGRGGEGESGGVDYAQKDGVIR